MNPRNTVAVMEELMVRVMDLNVQRGIMRSLMAKLNAALSALLDPNPKNDVSAANVLGAFSNAVEAQKGKKIADRDAEALIALADLLISLLTYGQSS